MINLHWSDPVVLICLGVILMGCIFFVWGVGRLRQTSVKPPADDLFLPDDPVSPDQPDIPLYQAPLPQAPIPSSPSFAKPPVSGRDSKEVTDRLEAMTQKLTEMQAVLNKQTSSTASVSAASAAGLGQGFSPETVDKLLSIIGNVISQVEVLQRSINSPNASSAAAPANTLATPAPVIPARPATPPMGSASALASASGGVIFPPSKAPGAAKPTTPPSIPPIKS